MEGSDKGAGEEVVAIEEEVGAHEHLWSLVLASSSTSALMLVWRMPSTTRLGKMSARGVKVVDVEEQLLVTKVEAVEEYDTEDIDPAWLEWKPPPKLIGGAASDKEVAVAAHGLPLRSPVVGEGHRGEGEKEIVDSAREEEDKVGEDKINGRGILVHI
uniref:Uncharacterized protein n=1 Tax=Oryza glumipatula TaxID=40148 RepID=A0A0D9ZXQ8_9ORYZ